jgi:S-DNA-T family DNA segregation ATPase FtsK/SpoIIIE
MAFQTRSRDPLLDSTTQAALEKRGRELLGLMVIGVGMVLALMLWSHSPDDPYWMLSSDAPIQNMFGSLGATVSATLMLVLGLGAWGIATVIIAWGARFVLHHGTSRLFERVIFAPIAIVLMSVYASTLVPGSAWEQSYGLGGMFGDMVVGMLMGVVPAGQALSVKIVSAGAGALMLAAGLHALGFTLREVGNGLRFLMLGVIVIYSLILKALGRGAVASYSAAAGLHATMQARREDARVTPETANDPAIKERVAAVVRSNPAMPTATRAVAEPALHAQARDVAAEVVIEDTPQEANAQGGGLFGLFRRAPEPQMPEPELIDMDEGEPDTGFGPDGARIRDKITNAIRNRNTIEVPEAEEPPVTGFRIEPRLTEGKGPRPLVYADPVTEPTEKAASEVPAAEEVLNTEPLVAKPLFNPEVQNADNQQRRVVQPAQTRSVAPSRRAQAEAQPSLQFEEKHSDYEHPPLNLLTNPVSIERHYLSDEALEENARMLESVLDDYGVKGEIVSVRPGPVVTMYELEPAPGLKASRVIGLADDIARSMSALSARVSTVPGRSVIGIELPNANREKVVLREILAARGFGDSNMRLPLALGKDIGGEPVVANLAKMPHLLIAGTTGSGKSVAINTMILSLLYKLTPDECRLIMIDPKMLELSVYDGIPHLLSPVVTDPKKAVVALKWVVGEMEERYRKMSKMGVRNIEGYNSRVEDALSRGELFSRTVQTGFDDATGDPVFETEEFKPEKMPYIVVIVDEMADLMMVAGKEIEACIQRLAQMARASGIHLIMATQRPSVDVITGTIKANFPTRISFQVTSKIDSRTILGEQGAEQLLGMGDMLYMAGGARITRVHGPFVSDEEVEEIVNYLKGFGPPEYMSGVVDGPDDEKEADIDLVLGLGGNTDGEDALYDQAVAIVIRDRKCSTSYIQRKLAIGYNKAARLVEQMEDEGVVSAANHVGKREILVPEQH